MALAGVQQAKEELQRKRANKGGGNKVYLKIADGEEETIRPLEQDEAFKTAYVHKVEKDVKGRKITVDMVCLDQSPKGGKVPCPGCEERAKIADPKNDRRFARSFKFYLNVIWRNGPIYETEEVETQAGNKFTRFKKDDSNQLIETGRGDVIALWTGGINAAEELDHANTKFKGLTSRDFTISRSGTGFDTKYKVSPAVDENGDVPRKEDSAMTEADLELAKSKYDLNELIEPASYDTWWGDDVASSREESERQDPRQKVSPFRRRSAE